MIGGPSVSRWIGVDLDGTLAEDLPRYDPGKVGPPIMPMVARVIRWLDEGKDVRIFTARVSGGSHRAAHVQKATIAIRRWCIEVFGRPLPVTCSKDYGCVEIWDDRAVAVQKNTGAAAQWTLSGLQQVP